LIEERAFADCKELTFVEFEPSSQLKQLDRGSFSGLASLQEIALPEGLVEIGPSCFANCERLADISLGQDSHLTELPDFCFWNCPIKELVMPRYIRSLYGTSLSSVESIGSTPFRYEPPFLYSHSGELMRIITKEDSIQIGDDVTMLGMGCCSLSAVRKVTFSGACQVRTFGAFAFASSAITDITVPKSVMSLGRSCFLSCRSLQGTTFEKPFLAGVTGVCRWVCLRWSGEPVDRWWQ
jgi:hypothetical protein